MSGPTLPIPLASSDGAWTGGKKAAPAATKGSPAFQSLLEEAGLRMPAQGRVLPEEGEALPKPGLGALLRTSAWPLPREGQGTDTEPGDAAAAEAAELAEAEPEVLAVDDASRLTEQVAGRIVAAMQGSETAARGAGAGAGAETAAARPTGSRAGTAASAPELPGQAQPVRAEASPAAALRVLHRETHFAPAEQQAQKASTPAESAPAEPAPAQSRRARAEAAPGETVRKPEPQPSNGAASQVREPALPQSPDAPPAPTAAPRPLQEGGEARGLAEPSRAADPAAAQPRAQSAGGPVKVLYLQLQPADLGDLTVKLRLTDAGLEVHLEATRQDTLTLLKNDREALAALLKSSGYAAEAVTVAMAERPAVPAQAGATADGAARQGDLQQGGSGAAEERGGRSDGRQAQQGSRGSSGGTGHDQDHDRGDARRPGDLYL